MARKTKEESQKTRDAILDGAERVFLRQGVANATMAQIADEAGVSRGAVYGHYDNKMEVCRAMVDRVFELDALRFPAEQASAGDTLVAVGMYYLRQFHEPGPAQRVTEFLYHKCERNRENRGILRRRELMDRATLHYVRRQLRRAIAQGELPPETAHRIPPAALLHDSSGAGAFALPVAGPGMGRPCVRGRTHRGRAYPPAAQRAGGHRPRCADPDRARHRLPLLHPAVRPDA